MKISKDLTEVLLQCKTDGNRLALPDYQLDRKLYQRLARLLNDLGGKWTRNQQCFKFNREVDDIIADIINTGEYISNRKDYGYFPTPVKLAKEMVMSAGIRPGEIASNHLQVKVVSPALCLDVTASRWNQDAERNCPT